MPRPRNRWAYALAIAVVIVAGLASRSSLATHIPLFIAAYAGDTLWALTVFLGLGYCSAHAKHICRGHAGLRRG